MPCPFCPENGQVDIIDQTDSAYAIKVKVEGRTLSGRYFVIPKKHITTLAELPGDWQTHVTKLVNAFPEVVAGEDYNMTTNMGRKSGQRLEHLHLWVVVRSAEEDLPSYELGLNALIDLCNTTHG